MKMKKYIILGLVVLLFLPSYVKAQEEIPPLQFGIKLGTNIGWLKSDAEDYSSEGSSFGFNWGFITDFNLAPNYGLTTGFNITYNNGKLKYPHVQDTVSGVMQRKYKLQYLEIPLCLKMRTKQIGYMTYYGKIGFGVSFNLKAKAKDVFNVEPEETRNIQDDIVLMRESLIVGAGCQYSVGGSTSITLEILFNNGFSDILKGNNSADESIENDATSKYIEINLGVIF